MKQGAIIVVVVVGALLLCGFTVWKLRPSSYESKSTLSTKSANLVDEKTALAELQADMQNVTPHFIAHNAGNGHATLTPKEQKIRDDLVTLYAARYYAEAEFADNQAKANKLADRNTLADQANSLLTAQNGIWLNAIGKSYILATEANAKEAMDEVLDSQTGQITSISSTKALSYYFAPERSISLYIEPQALYTYSLDQATTTLVVGSKLQGTETYDSGFADGPGARINPQETHTKNSITISIFDSSKSVPNPDLEGATMYEKIRQNTLSF